MVVVHLLVEGSALLRASELRTAALDALEVNIGIYITALRARLNVYGLLLKLALSCAPLGEEDAAIGIGKANAGVPASDGFGLGPHSPAAPSTVE